MIECWSLKVSRVHWIQKYQPYWAQVGFYVTEVGAKFAQLGPKFAQAASKFTQVGAKLAQDDPKLLKYTPLSRVLWGSNDRQSENVKNISVLYGSKPLCFYKVQASGQAPWVPILC